MELQFETTHRFLFLVMWGTGLRMPQMKANSFFSAVAYTTYETIMFLIGLYQFIFATYSAFAIGNFQDICNLGVIGSALGTGVVVTTFHELHQKRLQKFLDNCNTLNLKILNSELNEADHFRQMYLEVAKNNQSFARKIIFLAFWTPVLYCAPVPIIDAIKHTYRTNLPLPILYLYNDRLPGVYEMTFCFHILGLLMAVTKKIENDCFFLSLFKVQSVYLKWLSASLKRLGVQFGKSGSHCIKRKQVLWIEYHVELIKSGNELVSIYTPIIVSYYFFLIITVVCGLFTQIKNEQDNPIQGIGVGGWGVINIFQLYRLSSAAEELATECDVVAQEIYNLPWYNMNKSNADMLRLMLLMAKHPIKVTAFRAPTFLLNKETFLGFLTSVVTALVTFTKINDLMVHDSQSQL